MPGALHCPYASVRDGVHPANYHRRLIDFRWLAGRHLSRKRTQAATSLFEPHSLQRTHAHVRYTVTIIHGCTCASKLRRATSLFETHSVFSALPSNSKLPQWTSSSIQLPRSRYHVHTDTARGSNGACVLRQPPPPCACDVVCVWIKIQIVTDLSEYGNF